MTKPLDPTQQRVLGVLIEKELAVPESYPMTENALQAGCNQKNNREPIMALEEFEVAGTLMGLQLEGWVGRTERDGGRTTRYKHLVEQVLGVSKEQKPVLAELLVRGPQTPRELATRVARMGWQTDESAVEQLLRAFKDKNGRALVELLPRAAHQREARWAHTLGPRATGDAPAPVAAPAPMRSPIEERLAALEARVAALEAARGQRGSDPET